MSTIKFKDVLGGQTGRNSDPETPWLQAFRENCPLLSLGFYGAPDGSLEPASLSISLKNYGGVLQARLALAGSDEFAYIDIQEPQALWEELEAHLRSHDVRWQRPVPKASKRA